MSRGTLSVGSAIVVGPFRRNGLQRAALLSRTERAPWNIHIGWGQRRGGSRTLRAWRLPGERGRAPPSHPGPEAEPRMFHQRPPFLLLSLRAKGPVFSTVRTNGEGLHLGPSAPPGVQRLRWNRIEPGAVAFN